MVVHVQVTLNTKVMRRCLFNFAKHKVHYDTPSKIPFKRFDGFHKQMGLKRFNRLIV